MKQPTMPSKTLLQGAQYTPAAHTDISQRFKRMFEAAAAIEAAKLEQPANVQQLQRRRK